MQWWVIIKMIAGIIANLPFDSNEAEVRATLAECVLDASDDVNTTSEVHIPQTDWEELIGLLVPVIMWIIKRFGKPAA